MVELGTGRRGCPRTKKAMFLVGLVVLALHRVPDVRAAGEPGPVAPPASGGSAPESKWPELLAPADPLDDSTRSKQVGPNRECDWVYKGLGRFKNAARDPGFDPRFNPFMTVSRRGLTARVVGTLGDETLAAHGGTVEGVRAAFPWIVPVRQTAVHRSQPEDGSVPSRRRVQRGELTASEVIDLPPNSVMIVYPVSTANRRAGLNTLAGNWIIDTKVRGKPSNNIGRFGKFPFLLYTGAYGHAFHGPITDHDLHEVWVLLRGEVSHGCNRMEGEHVVELAVLLGCGADPGDRGCPAPGPEPEDDERVTVMEDFDHIPNPDLTVATGPVQSAGRFEREWVGVDVAYPRENPVPAQLLAQRNDRQGFLLEHASVHENRSGVAQPVFVEMRIFPTWDNRQLGLVRGVNCR